MINKNPNHLKEVVDILKESHIEKYVVLIGSWCELFYQELIDTYEANIRTLDIDFYYHEIRKPKIKIDFIKIMEKSGFFFDESTYPPKTKFFSDELEVEFLTRMTRSMKPTEKIEALNVYAECLPECEMFGSPQNIMTCYLEKYDIEMQIPTPVAYCMHKILINDDRKRDKQLKDKESIHRLIPFIEKNDKYVEDWKRIYSNFSKKEKKRFKNNLINMDLERFVDLCDGK